jgi:hypothetical protein
MEPPEALTIEQSAQIMKEALAGALPSLTTPEALAEREATDKELDEIHAKGHTVDVSCDYLDLATGTPLTFHDQTKPLALPLEGLTARAIRRHLTIDERMWFNRMIGEHGEAEVLKLWPSYEVQLNFARSL